MLSIPLEKLLFIVVKAREFAAKVDAVNPEDASDQADDDERQILEDRDDEEEDATEDELTDALAGLNSDEMDELLALIWIGRGDYDGEDWDEAVARAREESEERFPANLAANPLLAEEIEEGLDVLGYSLDDIEGEHL